MDASDPNTASKSHESSGALLRRIEQQKLETLASAVPCDPATLSRFAHGKGGITLDALMRLLEATDLRLVDANRTCVRAEELDFLRRVYATVVQHAPELLEEDPT